MNTPLKYGDVVGKTGWPPIIPPTSISELELSVRAANILNDLGISTVVQLTQLSERDLRRRRNCGKGTIKEIQTQLARLGLSLQSLDDPKTEKFKDQIARLKAKLDFANRRICDLEDQR